jgi:hypothetical protein
MKTLRAKRSSLPIQIIRQINYPNREYILNSIEKNFNEIKVFLFNAKEI